MDGRRALAMVVLAGMAARGAEVRVSGARDQGVVERMVTAALAGGADEEGLRRAVEALGATGDYEAIDVAVDGTAVWVELREAPILRDVRVTGVEDVAPSVLGLRAGQRARPHDLGEAARRAAAYLGTRGYPSASLDLVVERMEPRHATVTLRVEPGAPLPVLEISVEPEAEATAVRALAREEGLEAGSRADAAAVDRVVRRWRREAEREGRVGARARGDVDVGVDGARVRFVVARGIRPELLVDGEAVSRRRRRALLRDAEGSLESAAEQAKAVLLEELEAKGFFDASVELRVTGQQIALRVVEGSRYHLGDVRLDLPEGAGDIRSELATTRRGVGVSRTRVRRSALEEDRDRVEEGLREAGYLEAQVDAAVVVRDGRRLNVEFPVRPGPRTLVTRVEIEGDSPSAMPPLSIREGGPYGPARVRASAERLREALAAEGFRDARVDGLSGPDPDGGSGRVVVLRADAGPRYRVGGLAVRGALLRGPGTVERVAALPAGEIAAEDRLRRARDEIARIPLLSGARVSVARGDPEAATVVADVQETPRYRFRYGAGYNTEEGPIGTLGLTDAAFLGGARSLSILGRGGRAEHRAEASLRDPFLGPSGASASLYSGREEREGFSFTKRGGLVQMGLLPLSGPSARQDLSVRLVREEIHLMDVEISPEEVPRGARTSSISAVAVSYVWDGRDDLAAPRRGFRLRALGEVAGPVLGASAQYVKATAEAYAYAPLPASMVLALGVAVGGGEPWGDEEELPLARRFFLGGQQGMRAFDRDDVGPKDPVTGEPLGGEAFHLACAELRVPIRGRLGASLFYERGAVARTVDELGGEPVAMDVGVGVRYQTAAGPVRLEWAREIGGEDESRVFLSFGESF